MHEGHFLSTTVGSRIKPNTYVLFKPQNWHCQREREREMRGRDAHERPLACQASTWMAFKTSVTPVYIHTKNVDMHNKAPFTMCFHVKSFLNVEFVTCVNTALNTPGKHGEAFELVSRA